MLAYDELAAAVDDVIEREEGAVKKFLDGERRDSLGYLVGQVVQEVGPEAHPADARALLKRRLLGVDTGGNGAGG